MIMSPPKRHFHRGFAARLREAASAARALASGLRDTMTGRSRVRTARSFPAGAEVHLATGGRGDGPPDLDELWRDFNKKLGGLFNNKPGAPRPNGSGDNNGGPSFQPDMKSAGIGAGLIAGVAVLIWLGSGFFIVQEGQQAVVTQFGRYTHTVDAGFQWRFPYPFQAHESVSVTQLRSAYLFENRAPDEAVTMAAESAVREIVGRSVMDSVLYEQRDAIATDLIKSVQAQLDRLNAGILVVNVNVQSVQAPEQVQAAFDDAVKAGADRERLKNEGQAYANDVIPRAQGTAARLREEAEGYKARVVAQADGDAQRFNSVFTEFQKAPGVTRDRLYIDTMQQVYSNVTKVLVDSQGNSNLLYLPLDKLMQQAGAMTGAAAAATTPVAPTPAETTPPATGAVDVRSRDGQRTRDRDGR